MTKEEIRKEVRGKKRILSKDTRNQWDELVRKRILESENYQQATSVFVYVSYNQEVDTLQVIDASIAQGKLVAVPKIIGKEIAFCSIESRKDLEFGYQGIMEPGNTTIVEPTKNTIMLLPGLAFDRSGNRIGYGGGFYDRYLSKHRFSPMSLAALAYDFQVYDSFVRMEDTDQRIHQIITPSQTIICI